MIYVQMIVHHSNCNSNFRNGQSPPADRLSGDSVKNRKRGRPVTMTREAAFQEIVEFLLDNIDEQFTISKLNIVLQTKPPVSFTFHERWLEEATADPFQRSDYHHTNWTCKW